MQKVELAKRENKLKEIAKEYFYYMAENFPVMCSSDEFYFFPRSIEPMNYLDRLDSLDREKIKENVKVVRGLLTSLEAKQVDLTNMDEKIDLDLLKASMRSFLREFDEIKLWQRAPDLYLKIALFGLDQIISAQGISVDGKMWFILKRMGRILELMDEARANLKDVPEIHREVVLETLSAAVEFLNALLDDFVPVKATYYHEFEHINRKVQERLGDLKDYLENLSCNDRFAQGRDVLEMILHESYGTARTLDEVYEISQKELQHTSRKLERTASQIDPTKSWRDILADYKLPVRSAQELLELYDAEVKNLKDFLERKDVLTVLDGQPIKVAQTPAYLEPIRATASYSSPPTEGERDEASFYVTIFDGDFAVHKEYLFMTAHETYPGHHLLDVYRTRQKNLIRRLIESPLLYEGWASYAEQLVDELGYTKDSRQRLVQLRRQLWRATRAILDIQLHTQDLKLPEAEEALIRLGYHPNTAHLMARGYASSCGYQLCYTLGKYEIDRLRDEFEPKLGLKGFHDSLLRTGQIPFERLREKMRGE